MDLRAKRKRANKTTKIEEQKNTKKVEPKVNESEEIQPTYTHSLSIRCNTLLYITIQNWLNTAHTAQDFSYTSVADVIRGALESYRQGMQLTELDETGEYKQTTVRVTKEQAEFYKKLPSQMRRKILERAIRTFIKNQ